MYFCIAEYMIGLLLYVLRYRMIVLFVLEHTIDKFDETLQVISNIMKEDKIICL